MLCRGYVGVANFNKQLGLGSRLVELNSIIIEVFEEINIFKYLFYEIHFIFTICY